MISHSRITAYSKTMQHSVKKHENEQNRNRFSMSWEKPVHMSATATLSHWDEWVVNRNYLGNITENASLYIGCLWYVHTRLIYWKNPLCNLWQKSKVICSWYAAASAAVLDMNVPHFNGPNPHVGYSTHFFFFHDTDLSSAMEIICELWRRLPLKIIQTRILRQNMYGKNFVNILF